jgi:hypothetical protein
MEGLICDHCNLNSWKIEWHKDYPDICICVCACGYTTTLYLKEE